MSDFRERDELKVQIKFGKLIPKPGIGLSILASDALKDLIAKLALSS